MNSSISPEYTYEKFSFAIQMTNIAKLQIFDVALNYDVVFDKQNVPEYFYPKDINAFK